MMRWIRDRSFPGREEQRQIDCLTGITKDITSQKLLDAAIEKALQLPGEPR
jgi:PAS domain-containing protein